MAAKPKDIDRKGLELDYRAGIKSLRVLGAQYGLSGARVAQIAEEEGWTRDLNARIRAAAEEKLNSKLLDVKLDADKVEREEQVVEANANQQVNVVVSHRERIKKLTSIADQLTQELDDQIKNRVELESLGEFMHAPDDKGRDKLNEIYHKVIGFSGRVGSIKTLVETSKTLIGLERQAYGLADNANGEANSEQKAEISDTEAARRIAFVFASAMHKKEVANG
jgi:hypothetical protein